MNTTEKTTESYQEFLAQRARYARGQFDEAKHPRDEGGQFTSGSGTGPKASDEDDAIETGTRVADALSRGIEEDVDREMEDEDESLWVLDEPEMRPGSGATGAPVKTQFPGTTSEDLGALTTQVRNNRKDLDAVAKIMRDAGARLVNDRPDLNGVNEYNFSVWNPDQGQLSVVWRRGPHGYEWLPIAFRKNKGGSMPFDS